MSTPSLKKRFWKQAAVAEVDGKFTVLLDTYPLRTPAKAAFVLPNRAVAALVATEWDAAEGAIDPAKMPATRACNAAIDKVTTNQPAIIDMLAEYGSSDLLCYRADRPNSLIARQAAAWDPLLDWADAELGARLDVTTGVMPIAQPPAALQKLHDRLTQYDAFQMAAVHDLITISGSLVIGLAVATNHLTAEAGWNASRIDEEFQIEQWGVDDAAEDLANAKKADFLFADKFLAALKQC